MVGLFRWASHRSNGLARRRMSMSMSPGAVAFVAASQPSCARCIDETLPRTIFLDLRILAGCLFVIFSSSCLYANGSDAVDAYASAPGFPLLDYWIHGSCCDERLPSSLLQFVHHHEAGMSLPGRPRASAIEPLPVKVYVDDETSPLPPPIGGTSFFQCVAMSAQALVRIHMKNSWTM